MSIRPATGRLLLVWAARPVRGMWILTMAMSATTLSRIATMCDVFVEDSEPR